MLKKYFEELDNYFVFNEFNITTSAILSLQKNINTWISNGIPGTIIYGRPRIGKTRAIKCFNIKCLWYKIKKIILFIDEGYNFIKKN